MNPYIIIHGMHRNVAKAVAEVDYEIVVPRKNGESREKGTAMIGEKIEIIQNEDKHTTN